MLPRKRIKKFEKMASKNQAQFTYGSRTKADILSLLDPITLTGTVTISSGSTSMTGSGTKFTEELRVGDVIEYNVIYMSQVAQIDSDTQLYVTQHIGPASADTFTLWNPRRIKAGDSVFNKTDNITMYFSGNDSVLGWYLGHWCSGQAVPSRNASGFESVSEGQVLQPVGATYAAAHEEYDSGSFDEALGVAYYSSQGTQCIPVAVCGIHNTDITGTVTKGNKVDPSDSINESVVKDAGTGNSSSMCGVAMKTGSGSEEEILLNFIERL